MSETGMRDIDKIDVAYVANLARLHLSDEEIQTFQGQLDQIVSYVRKISELDLSDIEPSSHAVLVQNVFREDVVKPSLDHEKVIKNAPAHMSGQFKVPKIVE